MTGQRASACGGRGAQGTALGGERGADGVLGDLDAALHVLQVIGGLPSRPNGERGSTLVGRGVEEKKGEITNPE